MTVMRKWLPLLTVCLGTFMLLIDVTIVNVALPSMIKDLHESFASVQWVVDAYALTLAAFVLGAGSIADLVGRRRTYIVGVALFAVSSFACGIAPNSAVLVAARAVQGVGGAAMFATTLPLLNSNYTGRDRGTAYGWWGATAGASAAVGPIIGGLLTQALSWRWIFFVNLPLSVIAIVLCAGYLVDAHETHKGRVDVFGIIAFAGTCAAITYALIRANDSGWSNDVTWAMLGAAAILLITFVHVERHSSDAMLDIALLKHSSFTGVMIGGLSLGFAAFAAFTYTSIWTQSVLGLSPIRAGLVGLPMSLMAFGVSASIGRFLHGNIVGRMIGIGLLFIGAGGLLGALLTHGTATWTALIPGFLVVGIGVGLATPTLGSAAQAAVPLQRGGMAAGAVNTARQLGIAFGIAALGTTFIVRAQGVLADHGVPTAASGARLVAGGRSGALLSQVSASHKAEAVRVVHAAGVAGVQNVLLVSGIVGVVAGVVVLFLVTRGGAPAERPPAPREPAAADPSTFASS
jgi:EmrB/QacA subfamily drug resistance transporter